jgi:hypothetical protein
MLAEKYCRRIATSPEAAYPETSAPRLAVLERSLFVAAAVRGAASVSYTAYRVT